MWVFKLQIAYFSFTKMYDRSNKFFSNWTVRAADNLCDGNAAQNAFLAESK